MKNQLRIARHRVARAVVLLGLAAALGGCVSQQDYDRLLVENRTLTNRNQELQASLEEANSARDAMSDTRRTGDMTIGDLQDQLEQKDALIAEYERTISDLEHRMQTFAFGHLDAATDAALSQLAANHPDLLTYDSNLGMLRFNSDLTFASGSDEVSPAAKETLSQLARILQGSTASQYDLIIVGHTDSQPISAGTAQRHPTNMHLSCHRAISVRRELTGLGMPASKIEAAGWGEERPLVANAANGNTPANRRVEIYVGRSVGGMAAGAAPAGGRTAAEPETPPDRQPGITK
jgi:chemotaxis protein MotB